MGAEPTLEGPRGPSLEVAQSRARLGASQTLARRVGAAPAGSRAHSGRPICVTGFRRRQQKQDVSCFSSAEKEALPPPPATVGVLSFIAAVKAKKVSRAGSACVGRLEACEDRQGSLLLTPLKMQIF